MSASAKNMKVIVEGKRIHNENCPWGGTAVRVCMHPFDINRIGWEDGDVIAGLTVVSSTEITTGMIRVECDAEPTSDAPELTEAISSDQLVTA